MGQPRISPGTRAVSVVLCVSLGLHPARAVAQESIELPEPPTPDGYTVDAGDALGRIVVRAVECRWTLDRDPQAMADCLKRQLQGLWGAFVGDAKLFAVLGQEALRATSTVTGFGACMKAWGIETTDQILKRKLEQLQAFVRENESEICAALVVMWRLYKDPAYGAEIARAITEVVAAHLPGLADSLQGTECRQLVGPVCEALGTVTYEVLLALVLTVVTAEVGGAGGITKGAQAIAKVAVAAKRSPRLARFLEEIAKVGARAARRLRGLPRAASFNEHVFKGQLTTGNLIRGGFHTDSAILRYLDEVWGTGTRPLRTATRADGITEVFYRTTRCPPGSPRCGPLEVRVEILRNGVRRYHLPQEMFKGQTWRRMEEHAMRAGHPPIKTAFPASWTQDQIIRAVEQASRSAPVEQTLKRFSGEAVVDGVRLRFQGIDGEIVSAYPTYVQ